MNEDQTSVIFAVSNDGGKTGVCWREDVGEALEYLAFQNAGGMTDYCVVAVRKAPPTKVAPDTKPCSDCRRLRTLLAFSYGGSSIYADDGELQDSRALPLIDFVRDAPETIELKMLQRGMKQLDDATRAVFGGGNEARDLLVRRRRVRTSVSKK